MSGLAVLTPSRGRPERLTEMLDAIDETSFGPVSVYVGLDSDDAGAYWKRGHAKGGHRSVRYFSAPRMRLAAWTNHLAGRALADGHDTLAFLGDDHRPRTAGWDELVRDAYAHMGSGLVYGRDGLQDERLPTAPFWSADVIRALGWYYPPVLQHLYADDYWLRLGRDLGRVTYLPDVYVEHLHPSAGKAQEDDSYRASAALVDRDREAFHAFIRDAHPAILQRVREAL